MPLGPRRSAGRQGRARHAGVWWQQQFRRWCAWCPRRRLRRGTRLDVGHYHHAAQRQDMAWAAVMASLCSVLVVCMRRCMCLLLLLGAAHTLHVAPLLVPHSVSPALGCPRRRGCRVVPAGHYRIVRRDGESWALAILPLRRGDGFAIPSRWLCLASHGPHHQTLHSASALGISDRRSRPVGGRGGWPPCSNCGQGKPTAGAAWAAVCRGQRERRLPSTAPGSKAPTCHRGKARRTV